MESGMLQDQPHHSQWSEVLHSPHAGPASHPHHCSGHSGLLMSSCGIKLTNHTLEWSHHEHVDGLQFKSVNYQETSQVHLTTFMSEKTI